MLDEMVGVSEAAFSRVVRRAYCRDDQCWQECYQREE